MYQEAIDDDSRLIELDPYNYEYYFSRGWHYATLKMYEIAIEDYMQAIRINPMAGIVWYHLGLSYFLSGDVTTSIETAKKLRRIDSVMADELLREITK